MGKTIIITEKPSVAQEYRKVLEVNQNGHTNGYIEGYSPVLKKEVQITWAVGHLISLASVPEQKAGRLLSATAKKEYHWGFNNLPAIPDNYLYLVNAQTKDQYNVIKSLYTAKDIDTIYYAGDSGREGIYIQALIRNQIFKGKAPKCDEKVVWIDSYTKDSILSGIRNAKPYYTYQNMIDSGYERAISDWLIGMNFTEGLTCAANGLVVVGRVMTPTLAMIVQRQKEIDEFVPTNYYGINAKPENYKFVPKWKAVEGSVMSNSPLLYNESGFKKETDAKAFMRDNLKFTACPIGLTVESIVVTEKKEFAPLLFNLAELQAYCSKTFNISPAETLQIAQSLYEKKMITYPRTDARVLSSAVAKDLEQKFGKTVPAKYVDDSKITDHYAIIPTFENHLSQCNDLEKQVFNAIMLRFKAIFKPPYVYDTVNIILVSETKEKFFATEKNEKQLGYRELYQKDKALLSAKLPKKGEVLSAVLEINPCVTKAPASYTTGSLILAMEKAGKLIEDEELREQIKTCGIGTSATRANIIEKLAAKKYIEIDRKQKITPTETGKQIIPIVEKVDKMLISPEKTADMEQRLEKIAEGRVSKEEYTQYINQYITDAVNTIKGVKNLSVSDSFGSLNHKSINRTDFDCPYCKSKLKFGKFGYYCENKDFSGSKGGYIMTERDMKTLLSKGKTGLKKMHTKEGKEYKAAIILGEDKLELEFER